MTTVAKGFSTSTPAPVLNAIGKKPIEATTAVTMTGRKRTFVPSRMRSHKRRSCLLFSIGWSCPINTIPFNTATPNRGDKTRTCPGNTERHTTHPQSEHPAMADKGMAVKISSDCLTLLKVKNRRTKINPKATGTAIEKEFVSLPQILKLSAVGNVITGRHFRIFVHFGVYFFDNALSIVRALKPMTMRRFLLPG